MSIPGDSLFCGHIDVQSGKVSGTSSHSGVSVLLTEANFWPELMDTGADSAVNGGAGLRFSSDAAGANQLAHQVVEFATSATAGSRKAVVWVRIPTLLHNADTLIYVWSSPTAGAEAADSAYGSEAVWADDAEVFHGGVISDAAGTGADLTTVGSGATASTGGPFGGGVFTTAAHTDGFKGTGHPSMGSSDVHYTSCWVKAANFTANPSGFFHVVSQQTAADGSGMLISSSKTVSALTRGGSTLSNTTGDTALVVDTWHKCATVFDQVSNTVSHYLDGVQQTVVAGYGNNSTNTAPSIYIGGDFTGGYALVGDYAEIRSRFADYSADREATEYNNQSDPGTFAIAGTFKEGGVSDSITLTDIALKIIQRTPSTQDASVAVVGNYVGSPAGIQARVVDDGTTTEVVAWTTVDASPTGGVFSSSITVPQGGPYNLEVRFSDDTGVTDEGSFAWNVGALIGMIGQSQVENYFLIGTSGTASASLYKYDGSWSAMASTGNGAIAFGNALIADLGCPVGLLDYGVSGSPLRPEADTGSGDWLDTSPGSNYDDFLTGVTANGGALEAVLWIQGERDAKSGVVTEAEYLGSLESFIADQVRTDVSNASDLPNLPFFCSILGRITGENDANMQGIRNAQFGVTLDDYYIASYTVDLALVDGLHYTDASYTTHGTRTAQALADIIGTGTYHRGPQISSATTVSTTVVDVQLAHDGGTDYTPTTGITGFEVLDDGTPVTISSAVRQDASTIRITLSSATIGAVTVRYQYGADPNVSGAVLDNTSLALPLEGRDSFAAGVALTPVSASQDQTLTSPTLTQHNLLVVDSLVQEQGVSQPALTSGGSLAVDSVTQTQTATEPALTQAHILAVNGLTQEQTATAVTLAVAGVLSPAPLTQAQTASVVTLIQAGVLGVDALVQSQIVTDPTLSAKYTLIVDALAQSQSLEQSTLSIADVLAAAGLTQTQTAASVTLTAADALAVDALTQSQSAGAVALTVHGVLAVDSLTQAQLLSLSQNAVVLGWLDGTLVITAALGGTLTINPAR